jgi:hypothetical protein
MVVRVLSLLVLIHLNLVSSLVSQELKIENPNFKKSYQGAAPIVAIHYELCFKKKRNQELRIDSVKSVEDKKLLPFSLFKKATSYKEVASNKMTRDEKGIFRLSFNIISILSEERLPYTEDDRPIQYDMSKGISIYYTLNGKSATVVVNNFKELTSVILP